MVRLEQHFEFNVRDAEGASFETRGEDADLGYGCSRSETKTPVAHALASSRADGQPIVRNVHGQVDGGEVATGRIGEIGAGHR